MKKLMLLTGALAALAVCADEVPEVSNITMTQGSDSRLVTITYTLDKAPAIVTLDIQTNANGTVWSSIGGENIQHVAGDVWKKIETGERTITWRPDLSWPDHKIESGGARAVVTAWSSDNPPDYLVVNLASNAVANSETYYPAVEFLPGGLLGNSIYRTSSLVMRKIPAKGVTWEMGSMSKESSFGRNSKNEELHTVTLSNNYYIAVFETTQAQWAFVQKSREWPSNFTIDCLMRPVECVSYNEIRNAANSPTANDKFYYPKDPNPGSFLGLLRKKTGLAFDLPSEAQWEFACRAGHGTGYWGDGKPICSSSSDTNLVKLGRFKYNGGLVGGIDNPSSTCEVTNGTAIVGSYAPNSWGLYDMHGNEWEWCLDWFEADIMAYGGAVNVDPSAPNKTLSGATGSSRMIRSGGWNRIAGDCRAAFRNSLGAHSRGSEIGFRLVLPGSPAIK